jgi:hypothetical protein
MKIITRIQIVAVVIFVAVAYAAARYAMLPLGAVVFTNAKTIVLSLSGERPERLAQLKKKNHILRAQINRTECAGDSANTAAQWYSFLQETLRGRGFAAQRIGASSLRSQTGTATQEFSFGFRTTWRGAQGLVSALENGNYVCSVNQLKLEGRTPLDSTLDANLTVAFWRNGQP